MKIRILILEDNAADAELMQRELRKAGIDFTALWVQNGTSFRQALDEFLPNIILSDYALPGFDGLAALDLARQQFAHIPVIIVSGAIGEETAIETLKAGATDYVLKQRLSRLGLAVRRALEEAEELIKRKQAEERYSALFNTTSDGVWIHNLEGTILEVNDAYCRMTGYTREEILGMQASELEVKIPKEIDEHIKKVSDSAGHDRFESQHRRKDGSVFDVDIAAVYLNNEGGRIAIFARDITERKQSEQRRQELFEKEHHISEMLQQTLIPSQVPYKINGISIATRYKAALDEARVGGDFYDVFELGDDKIGVLIGDVTGKGLKAAIRVAEARYSIRSYAYLDLSPEQIMTLANAALIREDIDPSNMLTAFFAIVDASNGTITYSCAGHEPPIVCNADSNVIELEVTGAMLGVVRNAEYGELVYKLRLGDSVVMFTDGITEARQSSSDFFDKEGIIEHLTKFCDAPPEDIASALLEAATIHAGGNLKDDAAIVVLGYR